MILAVPIETPVTSPTDETVATAVLLLVHVPPAGEEAREETDPRHTAVFPAIDVGAEITLIFAVATHPLGRMYVTVVAPVLIPLNTPDTLFIVPTARILLVQVPPVGVPESVANAP